MDMTTTIIRNVEIPPTLPDMDTLTDLTGNITVKDVRLETDGLRVEGDLLWRGYFEESGSDCLWEGAEFFSEHLDTDTIRQENAALLTPKIVGLRGTALSESTFRMEFDIRWDEATDLIPTEEYKTEQKDGFPLPATKIKENTTEEIIEVSESVSADTDSAMKKIPQKTAAERKKEFIKQQKLKSAQKTAEKSPVCEETAKSCPCPQFCLRYYRASESETLEKIAEKFSASVAKLKACNDLDFDEVRPGKMIRIP